MSWPTCQHGQVWECAQCNVLVRNASFSQHTDMPEYFDMRDTDFYGLRDTVRNLTNDVEVLEKKLQLYKDALADAVTEIKKLKSELNTLEFASSR